MVNPHRYECMRSTDGEWWVVTLDKYLDEGLVSPRVIAQSRDEYAIRQLVYDLRRIRDNLNTGKDKPNAR